MWISSCNVLMKSALSPDYNLWLSFSGQLKSLMANVWLPVELFWQDPWAHTTHTHTQKEKCEIININCLIKKKISK